MIGEAPIAAARSATAARGAVMEAPLPASPSVVSAEIAMSPIAAPRWVVYGGFAAAAPCGGRGGDMSELDFRPVERNGGAGGLLLLCDHASPALPPEYGDLGLPPAAFGRHIAYDIGAAGITRRLAAALGAPAVLTTYSRLLIDPNRGLDDPTLVMRLSDGAIVPGNARADAAEIARRIERFWTPYRAAIRAEVDATVARGQTPVVFAIHSFTPAWKGEPRPWKAAILWDDDPRLAVPLIDALRAEPDLGGADDVGDNQPYDGAHEGSTLHDIATMFGFPGALIEVRQDLIADDAGQAAWAARLARLLAPILADPALRAPRAITTRTGG